MIGFELAASLASLMSPSPLLLIRTFAELAQLHNPGNPLLSYVSEKTLF